MIEGRTITQQPGIQDAIVKENVQRRFPFPSQPASQRMSTYLLVSTAPLVLLQMSQAPSLSGQHLWLWGRRMAAPQPHRCLVACRVVKLFVTPAPPRKGKEVGSWGGLKRGHSRGWAWWEGSTPRGASWCLFNYGHPTHSPRGSVQSTPAPLIFFFIIVDLQCSVSFCCTAR